MKALLPFQEQHGLLQSYWRERAASAQWHTLICADTEGHLFEVTSGGELALKVMPDSLPMTNSVFRAYRYTADHPALKGKDLSPKLPITEMPARPRKAEPPRGPGARRNN
jgi:hypothetical protein